MANDVDLQGLTEPSISYAWEVSWRQRDRPWFWVLILLSDFGAAAILVLGNQDRLTKVEALLLAAGGAAVTTLVVGVVVFLINWFAAPYRQRNYVRNRLIAIITVDPVRITPFPDGGPAYLRITNQGMAGAFRVKLLTDTGWDYYLGWEDSKRDRHLLTGETGEVLVAVLDDPSKDGGGHTLVFYEADKDSPKMKRGARPNQNTSARATVLSEHERPTSIDIVIGMVEEDASWDPNVKKGKIVLEPGKFELLP